MQYIAAVGQPDNYLCSAAGGAAKGSSGSNGGSAMLGAAARMFSTASPYTRTGHQHGIVKLHERATRQVLHYIGSQGTQGTAMWGYLRSAPPRLCVGLLRNDHGIIVPAVSTQVMQHQETSRWQQLKQMDILAMNLHTPYRVSYTQCAIDSLPSHDATVVVSHRQDGQEVIIEACAIIIRKINTIIFNRIAVCHIPA